MTQRRLSSVRAHFLKLAAAAVVPVFVLTGLAVAGEPPMLVTAAGIALATLLVGLAIMVSARFERATETLKAAITRVARGEEAAITPTFREGDDVVAALTSLETQMRQRSFFSHAAAVWHREIAESIPAMVWISRGDGRTVFQNRSVLEYTDQAGLPEMNAPLSLTHPDDQVLLQSSRMASAGSLAGYRIELRLRRHDGVYRWHIVNAAPLSLPDPVDGTYWVVTAIDIESLKQAEELQAQLTQMLERKVAEATDQLREETSVRQKTERQLRQTQKMEAISRLTGGIAHDLNNKLMVISANIDAVAKQIRDLPQLRRRLLSSLVAADQAAALLSKLLAFARQRDLHVQYIDIAEHLASITSLLDRSLMTDSIEVTLSVPEDLWPVETDPHELETAIVNLGVNARDAMKDGGTISIAARNIHVRKGTLADGALAGDFVQIVIADMGEGIDPKDLDHVFEPFFTTREASHASGLGLSQVHGFVKQLGGTVEISSTIGQGTSVALYLPRAALPARVGAKREADELFEDEESVKDAAEILVVDDEVEVALALQGMLEEAGYMVRTALNADEAIAAIRMGGPDLLLTDVTMPGTMDGMALARQVRQARPDLPVVLITGNPMVVAGSSEFPLLQKPINSRQLDAAIRRHLVVTAEPNVVQLFPGVTRDSP